MRIDRMISRYAWGPWQVRHLLFFALATLAFAEGGRATSEMSPDDEQSRKLGGLTFLSSQWVLKHSEGVVPDPCTRPVTNQVDKLIGDFGERCTYEKANKELRPAT